MENEVNDELENKDYTRNDFDRMKKNLMEYFKTEIELVLGKEETPMHNFVLGVAAVSYVKGRADKAKEIFENS